MISEQGFYEYKLAEFSKWPKIRLHKQDTRTESQLGLAGNTNWTWLSRRHRHRLLYLLPEPAWSWRNGECWYVSARNRPALPATLKSSRLIPPNPGSSRI